jgi:hypothetical protein
MALERTFVTHLSDIIHKAHEVLALFALLGLYAGILGLSIQRLRRRVISPIPTLALVVPLIAIGMSQLVLYGGQLELGWVDTGWRAMGVPVWLSFAFWQWCAAAILWINLGYLIWAERADSVGPRVCA